MDFYNSLNEPALCRARPLGEDSVLVTFEAVVDLKINRLVRCLVAQLEEAGLPGFTMAIPAYRSLVVYFDPLRTNAQRMIRAVETVARGLSARAEPPARLFNLPTVYGGEHGPDLQRLADWAGVSPTEVVERFTALKMPVFFLGYICSQAYLGGIPPEMAMPRHRSPRPEVAGGSFGIGGPQANILAVTSPSGLIYIGRTFVKVFDPYRFPPTAIRPGDKIQCRPVSEREAREAGTHPMEEFIEPDCS